MSIPSPPRSILVRGEGQGEESIPFLVFILSVAVSPLCENLRHLRIWAVSSSHIPHPASRINPVPPRFNDSTVQRFNGSPSRPLSTPLLSATLPAMELKYLRLDDPLYEYVCERRSDAGDPVLEELKRETAGLGEISRMEISQEQGTFLSILVATIGTTRALELGTFTGYSSLCIARALRPGGKLLCFDQSEEWTSIARKYWRKAGVENRIELRLGAAIPMLQQLEPGLMFDFAFIDAEKTEYDAYYELVLPRMRQNGLILFDNMLWGGRLGKGPISETAGLAIDGLNRKLANDPRVEAVLLPFADGIQLCRKR